MPDGLIILGLTALGCLTAITIKALDFARFLKKEEGLEEGAALLDARADDVETRGRHRLAERDRAAAGELRRRSTKMPADTLCKNCKHRSKDYLGEPDHDVCLASPAGDPHVVTGKHEEFHLCKDINTDKRCPKFQRR